MSLVAAPARPRSAFGRMPLRYLSKVTGSLVGALIGLTAITCGVYMIERTVGILEIAMRYNFSAGSFLSLVLLQLPTLAEFALPVASYAAAHFVMLARRERREFVALAAAGVSPATLALPLVIAAGISGVLSIAFTDTIAPAATKAYRLIEAGARGQVLAHRLPAGRFFSNADTVLYVGQSGPQGSALRLFQHRNGEIRSLLTSDCVVPETSGTQISLRLCDGDVYLFDSKLKAGAAPTHVAIGDTVYPFDATAVLGAGAAGMAPVRSIIDLMRSQGEDGVGDRAEAMSRLLAALACVLAASMAIVSVAYTSQHTRLFTFVGGCLTMLVLMALREPLAQFLAKADVEHYQFAALAFVLAALLLPAFLARLLDARLVAPAMVKT